LTGTDGFVNVQDFLGGDANRFIAGKAVVPGVIFVQMISDSAALRTEFNTAH
jgi:hypothetical protein